MNILIYILFCDKKSVNNIPYRKLSLNCKQHFKTKKEHISIKCLFNKVLSYLLYCKDMVKLVTSKVFTELKKKICSQIFYKIVVLESFAKFSGKHRFWSHFLIKLQA